jgi:type II secretory pathway component PulF
MEFPMPPELVDPAEVADEADRPGSTPLASLRRMRVPIALTATLAVIEVTWLRFGFLPALLVACLIPAIPILVHLGRAGFHRIPLQLAACAGALVTFAVARLMLDTLSAVGVAALVGLAVGVHIWRLKLRHLMVLLVVVAVLIRLGLTFGPSLLFVILAAAPPLIVASLYLAVMRRPEIEREALVSVLSMSAREGLPMGEAARVFAGLCSPRYRRDVEALAARLTRGQTISGALEAVPRALPSNTLPFARLGESGGSLAPALEQAVEVCEARRRDPVSTIGLLGYPVFVLLCVIVAAGYFGQFFAPRLVAIFRDYGFVMPEPTRSLILWTGPLSSWPGPEPEALLNTILQVLIGITIAAAGVWSVWRVGLLPPLPWTWLARRRALAAALRGVSVGVAEGRPMVETLEALARGTRAPWLRRRMLLARGDIQQGRSWVLALRRRGLLRRADAAVIDAAERVGNVPWALRETGAAQERGAAHRLRFWTVVLQPLTLVALGALVLIVAASYFYPLVHAISQLAE